MASRTAPWRRAGFPRSCQRRPRPPAAQAGRAGRRRRRTGALPSGRVAGRPGPPPPAPLRQLSVTSEQLRRALGEIPKGGPSRLLLRDLVALEAGRLPAPRKIALLKQLLQRSHEWLMQGSRKMQALEPASQKAAEFLSWYVGAQKLVTLLKGEAQLLLEALQEEERRPSLGGGAHPREAGGPLAQPDRRRARRGEEVQSIIGQALTEAVLEKARELLDSDDPSLARYKTLSVLEMAALTIYTGPSYAQMNGVLRGTITDPIQVAAWKSLCDAATRGLSKCGHPPLQDMRKDLEGSRFELRNARKWREKGAEGRSEQKAFLQTEEGRIARQEYKAAKKRNKEWGSDPRLYRGLRLDPGYEAVFKSYQAGATLTDPAFVSMSTRPYSVTGNETIMWQVRDPTGGAYVKALSLNPQEDEVLLPGARLQIDRIQVTWQHYPDLKDARGKVIGKVHGPQRRDVENPIFEFPRWDPDRCKGNAWNDQMNKYWIVDMTLLPWEGAAPEEAPGPGPGSTAS